AIHDAEELLAEKRAAVSRTEDKLSLAKLELREKLQRGKYRFYPLQLQD
ncbi:hypothetical protein chiPu_0022713, partial [Chiloscyllium punctatum]|nr:hypothetical protein [Chiloscyllium punctatum]